MGKLTYPQAKPFELYTVVNKGPDDESVLLVARRDRLTSSLGSETPLFGLSPVFPSPARFQSFSVSVADRFSSDPLPASRTIGSCASAS